MQLFFSKSLDPSKRDLVTHLGLDRQQIMLRQRTNYRKFFKNRVFLKPE